MPLQTPPGQPKFLRRGHDLPRDGLAPALWNSSPSQSAISPCLTSQGQLFTLPISPDQSSFVFRDNNIFKLNSPWPTGQGHSLPLPTSPDQSIFVFDNNQTFNLNNMDAHTLLHSPRSRGSRPARGRRTQTLPRSPSIARSPECGNLSFELGDARAKRLRTDTWIGDFGQTCEPLYLFNERSSGAALPQENPFMTCENSMSPANYGMSQSDWIRTLTYGEGEISPLIPGEDLLTSEDRLSVPVENRFAPGADPLVPDQNPLAPDDQLLIPTENFLLPAEDPLGPDEVFLIPEEGFLVPAETRFAPQADLFIPNQNLHVPDQQLLIPAEDFLLPDEELLMPAEDYAKIAEYLASGPTIPDTPDIPNPESEPRPSTPADGDQAETKNSVQKMRKHFIGEHERRERTRDAYFQEQAFLASRHQILPNQLTRHSFGRERILSNQQLPQPPLSSRATFLPGHWDADQNPHADGVLDIDDIFDDSAFNRAATNSPPPNSHFQSPLECGFEVVDGFVGDDFANLEPSMQTVRVPAPQQPTPDPLTPQRRTPQQPTLQVQKGVPKKRLGRPPPNGNTAAHVGTTNVPKPRRIAEEQNIARRSKNQTTSTEHTVQNGVVNKNGCINVRH